MNTEIDNVENIFGAYLNMSCDNVFNTIRLMAGKMKVELKECSGEDKGGKKSESKQENVGQAVDVLFGKCESSPNIENMVEFYFPWIKALTGLFGFDKGGISLNDKVDFYKAVIKAFAVYVEHLRNRYTHKYHSLLKYDEEIDFLPKGRREKYRMLSAIDHIYSSAVNLAKQRFGADERDVEHLRMYKMEKKKVVRKTVQDGFHYSLHDGKQLTDMGVAFVAALFLNRKYGYLFLKQLRGFKRSDQKHYQLTLETFLAYSNIKPVDRLKSDKQDEYSLGLDILNELARIPKELYDTLPLDYVCKYLEAEDSDIRSRVRYQSRFEQLALESLSRMDEFKNLRFYTYLGNYVYKGYTKKLIDGSEKERYLTSRLCGFCRSAGDISSDDIAAKNFVKVKDANEPGYMLPDGFEPHILRATPHFIINNNNIGIKIGGDGGDCLPVINEKGAKCPEPDCWLSIYELPAMLFYAYLREDEKFKKRCPNDSVEDIIKNCMKDDRPKDAGRKDGKETLLLRRIGKALIWTETKLAEVDRLKGNVAYGKKAHLSLKAGRMADTLAHDMMWLQPAGKGSDKITGANFQALQSALAFFRRGSLAGIFSRAGLTVGTHRHPFLCELDADGYATLQDFYVAYLKARKKYFEGVKAKVCRGKLNTPCHPLRDLQRDEPEGGEAAEGKPVFLPRGIFTDAIVACLKQSNLRGFIVEKGTDKQLRTNAAYLIMKFYEKEKQGGYQDFYSQPRRYDYLEKGKYLSLDERKDALRRLKPARIPVSKANEPVSKEEHMERKKYKAVCDNEAAIRLYQVQDVLLMLMAKRILSSKLFDISSLNVGLDRLNGLFDIPVSFTKTFEKTEDVDGELKITDVNDNLKITDVDDNLKITDVGDKVKIKVVGDNVKIKDYGKVCRLAIDGKFMSLVDVLNNSVNIAYSDYLKEEEIFEKCRIKMVERCRSIEERIVGMLSLELKGEKPNFNFTNIIKKCNKRLKDENLNAFDKMELEFFKNARNMFMHSEYKDVCVEFVYNEINGGRFNGPFFAEEIYKHFDELANKMECSMKKLAIKNNLRTKGCKSL